LKGGDKTLAITKERKNELVSAYVEWSNRSEGLILTEYNGLNMKQIDELRGKIREAGGEFHIIKNTLAKVALKTAGMPVNDEMFTGSTAIVFAYKDTSSLVKVINDFGRTVDIVKIKGGYLDRTNLSAAQTRSLADLPPLSVLRAQLLGVLQAPASKLVRTLSEPARSLAGVLQAYADKDSAIPAAE
jgi:large subunit ribosomal protein L10